MVSTLVAHVLEDFDVGIDSADEHSSPHQVASHTINNKDRARRNDYSSEIGAPSTSLLITVLKCAVQQLHIKISPTRLECQQIQDLPTRDEFFFRHFKTSRLPAPVANLIMRANHFLLQLLTLCVLVPLRSCQAFLEE